LGNAHIEIVRAVYAPSQKLLHIAGMPLKTESHVILSADLQRFAGALFVAAGVAPAMADEWAKSLVWANLRGVDSHGVLRIPGYIERLKTNAINPTPNMRVEKRAGAIAFLEADRAPGAVADGNGDGGGNGVCARSTCRMVRSAQHYPRRGRRLFRAAGGERPSPLVEEAPKRSSTRRHRLRHRTRA
jgi:Malate/L-lactate dehydrogenase